MDRETIRLEALKLGYRVDRTPAQVLLLAKEYEAYIVGSEKIEPVIVEELKEEPKKEIVEELKEEPKKSSSRSKKNSGNTSLFE